MAGRVWHPASFVEATWWARCRVELWEIRSHDPVEGLEMTSSSIPSGKGIEGVSPLGKHFTGWTHYFGTSERGKKLDPLWPERMMPHCLMERCISQYTM